MIEVPIVMLGEYSRTRKFSREDNAKFNFLGIISENKSFWRVNFQAFREPKIQNFGNHGATFGV